MYDVQQTPAFCQWLSDLRDKRSQARDIAKAQALALSFQTNGSTQL